MELEPKNVSELDLKAVSGFNGQVHFGMRLHPDKEHLIYPLGSTIVLVRIKDDKRQFLHGHTSDISCLSMSKSGVYIASGQVNYNDLEAEIIVWDYAKRCMYTEFVIHDSKVEALAFSPNDKYLVSLGGQDDGRILLWNLNTKQAVCSAPAMPLSLCHRLTVKYSNTNDNLFVSAGRATLQIWELDQFNKIKPTDCKMRKLKRTVKCVEFSPDDEFFYCGTTTGDILKINTKAKSLNDFGPVKTKHNLGANVLKVLATGELLVGSGFGTLTLCSPITFKAIKHVQMNNGVTSIALKDDGRHFFAGTDASEIYCLDLLDFKAELISTNHHGAVFDVSIAFGSSDLFVTGSEEAIRVWHKDKSKQLLRISEPCLSCNSVHLMIDGHSIVSGWNDGKIRIFAPQSGRLMLIIHNAHRNGVSAIKGSTDCKKIVSGGQEGTVCVWELLKHGQRRLAFLTEHKATVRCVQITKDDKESVTASMDGTCIIWDIVKFVRIRKVISQNSSFKSVCYHPDEHQIITSGTDRKIVYWDVHDGTKIRELQGTQTSAINCMHVSHDGRYFVTGGDDKLVRVWDYMEGVITHVGKAHGGGITSVEICCNNSTLISTSADGAIMRWKFPHPLLE
ncbi:cilia- and flagella-associated protein 52 [Corythoichthys intestinalis]|uniref:cilia- and flagella-associated protein 52 n=1 Tax=Corythoichthys intestinalis TaxID=161448 RepID=UPI0025A66D32|nr:cilia- and flagella-associated protein 52 [Corythoichthys intestinalis]XP_057699573.1 cilia- and flagella-associated protein 52 [Corythoichthys intestinalis]XP_061791948.1 cilia- and flagella-associated protein 52-like [Nerophis lumbriciformis]